jgi:DNA polymerase-1
VDNLFDFFEQFWLPSLEVLSDMEQQGILLDVDYLEGKLPLALAEVEEMEGQLNTWAKYYIAQRVDEYMNWNSHSQVKEFLYEFKNYPIPPVKGTLSATKKNTKRERVSCESAIDWLSKNVHSDSDREMLRVLAKRNKTVRLAQFIEKLPLLISADGRLRCSIGPNTDTGRLSCKNPNLQQIPVRADRFGIRNAFIARPGYKLIVADYSQLEMYVMAHFLVYHFDDHSLEDMLKAGDAHTAMAFKIWGDQLKKLGATPENIKDVAKKFRDNAKTINYAVPYGKTAVGLGSQILDKNGAPIGKKKAQDLLDDFFEANPGLDRLFQLWRDEARETGYITTLLGRTRPLPGACAENQWERWAAERRAVNTPVQGSAADIVTAAMLACVGVGPTCKQILLARELADLGAVLLLQIHDELIFEVPAEHADRACAIVQEIMEDPFDEPLTVQLHVDAQVGDSWGECK